MFIGTGRDRMTEKGSESGKEEESGGIVRKEEGTTGRKYVEGERYV